MWILSYRYKYDSLRIPPRISLTRPPCETTRTQIMIGRGLTIRVKMNNGSSESTNTSGGEQPPIVEEKCGRLRAQWSFLMHHQHTPTAVNETTRAKTRHLSSVVLSRTKCKQIAFEHSKHDMSQLARMSGGPPKPTSQFFYISCAARSKISWGMLKNSMGFYKFFNFLLNKETTSV